MVFVSFTETFKLANLVLVCKPGIVHSAVLHEAGFLTMCW